MGVDFYLLPKKQVGLDRAVAVDWLERENRQFAVIPETLDPVAEARKQRLAELLLKMKPGFEQFEIRHQELAEFDEISVDEASRKYRYVEINGPGIQFDIFDHYVAIGVSSKMDTDEFDAILAALSAEGGFVLYDPQSDEVSDLSDESFAG